MIGLFVIAVLWAAYVAQPVVVPVVLAWTIATIVLPVVTWMQGYRVPRGVAVLLVTRRPWSASSPCCCCCCRRRSPIGSAGLPSSAC